MEREDVGSEKSGRRVELVRLAKRRDPYKKSDFRWPVYVGYPVVFAMVVLFIWWLVSR